MTVFLFVHGTGVRKPAFTANYALIQSALEHYAIDCRLAPCLWGDDLGASLPRLSLPRPVEQPAAPEPWTREQEIARWELLYYDPLFELRLLVSRTGGGGPLPPSALRPAQQLWDRIAGYQGSDAMRAFLARWDLAEDWAAARAMVIGEDSLAKQALLGSPQETGEPAQAIARALVAQLLAIRAESERPLLDRDRKS